VLGRLTGLEVGSQEAFREREGINDEDLKIQNEIASSNKEQAKVLRDLKNNGIEVKNLKVVSLP